MENEKIMKNALESLENKGYEDAGEFVDRKTSLGVASGFDDIDDVNSFAPGYIEIYSSEFPSKGIFYGKESKFLIRAASVNEIKQFSTMNEEDPYSVDDALNQILKSCLVYRDSNMMKSYKDLKEEDRIYVILAIRELTFVKGENALTVKTICNECGTENQINITKDSFDSNEPDQKLMRYYNEDLRLFEVKTKSSGIIKIQAPSVGIMMEVTKYMQKTQMEGKKLDKAFIKTLPYMVSDWRGLNDKTISNLQMDFMSWNATQFQTVNALIEMCKVGVKENITSVCENIKCQAEVIAPISFPNGIKSIFIISDINSELL